MASFSVSYTYDGAGNRLTETDNLLGQTTLYSYDAANRLLTMAAPGGTTTFTYDQSGNRTRKETPSSITDYTYDAKDRLIKIEPVSGDVELTYNAAGVRVRKETPGEVKKFIYDLENLLQETDADGLTERAYTQSTEEYGDLISQHADDETSYPEFDAQWSTAVLLDENESVTDRYRYRAFGIPDHESGSSPQPLTFAGKRGYYRDEEVDLYFARARYYDPAAGRWLTKDPLGLDAGDNNLYRYVENNPVNRVDPSGKVTDQLIGKDTVKAFNIELGHVFSDVRQVWLEVAQRTVGEPTAYLNYGGCSGERNTLMLGLVPWFKPGVDHVSIIRRVSLADGNSKRIALDSSLLGNEIETKGRYAADMDLYYPDYLASDGMPVNYWKLGSWWAEQAGLEAYRPTSGVSEGLTAFFETIKNSNLACDVLKIAASGEDVCGIVDKIKTKCSKFVDVLGSSVPNIIGTLYNNGPDVLGVFVDAVKMTFEDLKVPANLLDVLLKGFLKFLGLEDMEAEFKEVFGAIWDWANGTGDFSEVIKKIFPALLKFFKLSADNLFKIVSEGTGVPDPVLVTLYSVVDAFVTDGPGAAWDFAKETFSDAVSHIQSAVQEFLTSIPTKLQDLKHLFVGIAKEALGKLLGKLASGLASGGLSTLLQGLLQFMDFAADGCDIGEKIITGVANALSSLVKNPTQAASTIKDTLKNLIVQGAEIAIAFLAKLAGVPELKDKVNKARDSVNTAISDLIRTLVTKLKGAMSGIFEKLGISDAVTAPEKEQGSKGDDEQTEVAVYVDGDGNLMLKWNPTCSSADVDKANSNKLNWTKDDADAQQVKEAKAAGKDGSKRAMDATRRLKSRVKPKLQQIRSNFRLCCIKSGFSAFTTLDACAARRRTDALTTSLGTSPYPVPSAAHHIFPVSEFDTDDGIRMCCLGIDLNSGDNGLWLPTCQPKSGKLKATIHRGPNSPAYIKRVKTDVGAAKGKSAILSSLAGLGRELKAGTLRINNADQDRRCK